MGSGSDDSRSHSNVPYYQTITNRQSNGRSSTTRKIQYLHFLPESQINASVVPEMKYRESLRVLYKSVLRIKETFQIWTGILLRSMKWKFLRKEAIYVLAFLMFEVFVRLLLFHFLAKSLINNQVYPLRGIKLRDELKG